MRIVFSLAFLLLGMMFIPALTLAYTGVTHGYLRMLLLGLLLFWLAQHLLRKVWCAWLYWNAIHRPSELTR